MTKGKTLIGLTLFCMVVTFAATAHTATATPAKNTTLFTCVSGAKGFSDAHCDTPNLEGKFGHVAMPLGKTTLSVTNAKTANSTTEAAPAIIKGTVFGVKNEITCKTTTGEGSGTNEEPQSKVHKYGITLTTHWTSCTVNKPSGLGCKVKEPIEFKLNGEGVEELGAGKNEMGLELKPAEGETFAEYTLESCFVAGTYKITGTAIAVGTPAPTEKHWGATAVLTNAKTKETLKLAGNPAELSAVKTLSMSGGGSPISVTTVT